jgi:hypothetical protein
MSQVNGHSHRLVFLLTGDNPAWFQEISVHLTNYDLRMVNSTEEALQFIKSDAPDAIVATPTSDTITFFDSLRNMPTTEFHRPVLALIAIDGNFDHNADLLLPTTPNKFEENI